MQALGSAPVPIYRLTKQQRAHVGAFYLQHGRSIVRVQDACRDDPIFAGRPPPTRTTILRCFDKFERGDLAHAAGGHPPRTARSDKNIILLYGLVREKDDQSISTLQDRLRIEFDVHMSHDSIWKALHDDLKLYAFKYQSAHELRLEDLDERYDYALKVEFPAQSAVEEN